jgi:hypothetical protein
MSVDMHEDVAEQIAQAIELQIGCECRDGFCSLRSASSRAARIARSFTLPGPVPVDTDLSPMRVVSHGPCGVGLAISSQWRNTGHWHTVWPEGEHWCFRTVEEAVERAAEVRDIWLANPGLAPVTPAPEAVDMVPAARLAEDLAEWADWIEGGMSAAGLPEPFTLDTVLGWLRSGRKPFGVSLPTTTEGATS